MCQRNSSLGGDALMRCLSICLLFVSMAALTGCPPHDYPPLIAAATAVPEVLRESGGDVAVSARVTDKSESSVAAVRAYASGPPDAPGPVALVLTSGTDQEGQYQGVLVLPANASGQDRAYNIVVEATDDKPEGSPDWVDSAAGSVVVQGVEEPPPPPELSGVR